MLEGIEVLNKTEIMSHPIWAEYVGIIFFFATLIFLIIGLASRKPKLMHLIGIITSFLISIICVCICGFVKIPTEKYVYQVTIDNSVSMTEFYEMYEIIEVNGKIYTIKEK